MYCGKCGKENPDTNHFCTSCGAKLTATAAKKVEMAADVNETVKMEKPALKERSNKGKLIGIFSGIVLLAGIAGAMLLFFTGSKDYHDTVKQFFTAVENEDGQSLMKLLPKEVIQEILAQMDMDEAVIELQEPVESINNGLTHNFGPNWEFTYQYQDASTLSKEEIRELKAFYKEELNIQNIKINEAKRINLEVEVSGYYNYDRHSQEIVVIKAGRSWYMDFYCLGELIFYYDNLASYDYPLGSPTTAP